VPCHWQYVSQHLHLIYFWELDGLDLLVPTSERLSSYHHEHHVKLHRRFGIFGYVPDWVYPAFWKMFGIGKPVHAATGAPTTGAVAGADANTAAAAAADKE
jgi:hypothetical protein